MIGHARGDGEDPLHFLRGWARSHELARFSRAPRLDGGTLGKSKSSAITHDKSHEVANAATLVLAGLVLVLPSWAQNADTVLLKGKIVKMEWVNPHAWIHVEVAKPDGAKEVWMVECGSPNSLLRRGVNRDSLPPGTEIVVDGYQTRDHSLLRANGRNVTYPDGRKLFLGSSGPGEPPASAVPTAQAKPPEGR